MTPQAKLSAYDAAMSGPPSALLARARIGSSYGGASPSLSSEHPPRGPLPYRLPPAPAADPYASPTKPARPTAAGGSPNSPVSPLKEGSPAAAVSGGASRADSRSGPSPPPPPRPTKSPQPEELRAARGQSPEPSPRSQGPAPDWRASFAQAATKASVRGMVSAIQDPKAGAGLDLAVAARSRSSSPRPPRAPAAPAPAVAAAGPSDRPPSDALRARAWELQQRSSSSSSSGSSAVNPRDSYMAVLHEAETLESVARRLRDSERRLSEAETTTQQLRQISGSLEFGFALWSR